MALYAGRKVTINRINPGVDSVNITDAEGKSLTVSKQELVYTDAEVQGMKNRDGEIVKESQTNSPYRTVSSEQAKVS
jgi:hypothetical protein